LLTYADMITLLMAFFILMFTMAKVDVEKLHGIIKNAQGAMGYPSFIQGSGASAMGGFVTSGKISPDFMPPAMKSFPATDGLVKLMRRFLKKQGLKEVITVQQGLAGMKLSIAAEGILFERGSTSLTPKAKLVLDEVGTLLAGLVNPVQIEGHTDEFSLSPGNYNEGNWRLSSARALSVLLYLRQKNYVSEKRMQMAAFASNQPIRNPQLTPEERGRLSRRVDITIMGRTPIRNRLGDPMASQPELTGEWE